MQYQWGSLVLLFWLSLLTYNISILIFHTNDSQLFFYNTTCGISIFPLGVPFKCNTMEQQLLKVHMQILAYGEHCFTTDQTLSRVTPICFLA